MTEHLTVGDAAYRDLLHRMNELDRLCSQRLLSVVENAEYRRGRAELERAELEHAQRMAGATE
jgi:hypothetical protein